MNDNQKKTITLVCTLIGKLYRSAEHLGIGMLAAVLRNENFNVRVLYINGLEDAAQLAGQILDTPSFLIGFNAYAKTVRRVLQICEIIKERHPQIHISLGGPTPTFEDNNILEKCRSVDSIVRGEGEWTLLELVKALHNNSAIDWIKGLSYRKDDLIIRNPDRQIIKDLNLLPFPDRDFFHEIKPEYLIIETSRGCVANCAFCTASNKKFYGRKVWRGRCVMKVVDEIEELVARYNVRAFNFIDASFEDPGKLGKIRAQSIGKEIIKRKINISFMVHFRSESIDYEDLPMIDLLINAGLERVSLGLESGYEPTLRLFNKRATVEDNKRILKIAREKHLGIVSGFIMFQPYASIEELRQNVDFLRQTNLACRFENFEQHIEVYPGIPLKDKMLSDGLIKNDFDFSHDECEYSYIDQRIQDLAVAIGDIANDHAIEFEMFDLQLQVFCIRLRKHEQSHLIISEIDEFENRVNELKMQLGYKNSDFFDDQLDNIEKGTWSKIYYNDQVMQNMVEPTRNTIKEIRKIQFKLLKSIDHKKINLSLLRE